MERLIGQGRTADVYYHSENKVVKVFHKKFVELAYEEYDKVQMIESLELSAPYVYELIDIGGKKGIVYEYAQGISMLSMMRKNPFKVTQYAKQLAELHAEIHSKPITGLQSIKESLTTTIQNVKIIDEAERKTVIDYLLKLPDDDRLCHYDFHPGNVLLFEGNAKIIDWMTAGFGNPCADISRTSVILRSNVLPPNTSLIEGMLINIFRKIFYRSYINHYLKITKISQEEVEQWLLPVTVARLAEEIKPEFPYLNRIIKRELPKRCLSK